MSLIAAVAGAVGSVRIRLTNATVSDSTITPTNASAQYQLTSGGVVNKITVSGGTVQIDTWKLPAGVPSANYEAMVTVTTGSLSSGTTGAWVSLSSTRTWVLNRVVLGTNTCEFTVQIRSAASGAVLTSADIVLTAEKTT